jgi:hypothetical protein
VGCILSPLCGWGGSSPNLFVTFRGAEAPLFHGCAGVCGGTNIPTSRKGREKWGTQVKVKIDIKIKPNIKGNGQEFPFHTGKVKSNVNVKGECCGRLCVPPFAKNAKDGAPSAFFGMARQNPRCGRFFCRPLPALKRRPSAVVSALRMPEGIP